MSEAKTMDAKTTTDHAQIRRWAEDRGGRPATVSDTGRSGEAGVLRLDFQNKDDDLDPIEWGDFFAKFEKEKLAFLYQDKTDDGSVSRFHKFVQRS